MLFLLFDFFFLFLLDKSLDPNTRGLNFLGSGTTGAAFKGFLDKELVDGRL